MAHKGAFRQVFVVFGAMFLWLIPAMTITSHYPRVGDFVEKLFVHIYPFLPIPVLLLGLVPAFAILWTLGGDAASVGRAVCIAIFRTYRWAFSLMDLLNWDRAPWIGELLSVAIAMPFYLPLWVLGVAVLWLTWPINAALGVVVVVLALAAGLRSDAIEKGECESQYVLVLNVVRMALAPLAFGMFGVSLVQLWFSVYDTNSDRIRKMENSMAYASAAAHDWVSFSVWGSIGLAAGLIVLVMLVPNIHAAARLLSLKTWASRAAACLVCFSSFSFFSQTPFKYEDWKDLKRIQAEKRTEDSESKKIAVAEAYLIVKNLTADDARYYARMLSDVNDTFPYGDHGEIIETIVKERLSAGSSGVAPAVTTTHVPDDFSSESDSGRKGQALAVVQDLFSTLIGAATPEVRGLAGKFIEEFVDQESESLFENHIRPTLYQGIDQIALAAASAKLPEMQAQASDANDHGSEHSEMENIKRELETAHQKINEANWAREERERAEHPVEEEAAP